MDDADKRESGAGEKQPPKIKAEDNPWYLLATLYGVPVNLQDERRDRNRRAWNRYFAANLDEDKRAPLIKEGRHSQEELTRFSEQQMLEIGEAFAERSKGSGANIELPASDTRIDFTNVQFDRMIDFSHYIFIECLFRRADFSDRADFRNTTFLEGANFTGVKFRDQAWFTRATFFRQADFKKNAIFCAQAYFLDANFVGFSNFADATFSGPFDFRGANFSSVADLGGVTFAKDGSFDDVIFSREVSFVRATFCKSGSFVNTEMKGETSFKGAKFLREPPKFFGAKLHQGTVWRGITWPPFPKSKDEAGKFLDAYACLKLEMDRLKSMRTNWISSPSNCNRAAFCKRAY